MTNASDGTWQLLCDSVAKGLIQFRATPLIWLFICGGPFKKIYWGGKVGLMPRVEAG